jgi:GTP cyclohydrolase II
MKRRPRMLPGWQQARATPDILPVLHMVPRQEKKKMRSGRRAKGTRKSDPAIRARIVAEAKLPTSFGAFTILGVKGAGPQEEAAVLLHGTSRALRGKKSAPLVRVHSQCLTGDVFTSQRCDCRSQLELALRKIAAAPSGLLLYLPQEGRGIGLLNKLRAYELQDGGMDTVQANEKLGFAADTRDYSFSAAVLKHLGVRRVRLLSNNPDKVQQLEQAGIRVVERVPCQPRVTQKTRLYLTTKKSKLGHLLAGL